MHYHSLVDELEAYRPRNAGIEFVARKLNQAYRGSVDKVIDELSLAIEDTTVAGLVTRILHPARLLRGVLNYRVQHPHTDPEGMLVDEGVQTAIGIYRGESGMSERLDKYRAHIHATNPKLLRAQVLQPKDKVTSSMMVPVFAQLTLTDLCKETEGDDILFVALAHGGVAAGLDVFLRYVSETSSERSQFYPVRFSRLKLGDSGPRMHKKEYVRLSNRGRRIVVYDEDICTGKTIKAAGEYFSELFNKPVIATTNNTAPFSISTKKNQPERTF